MRRATLEPAWALGSWLAALMLWAAPATAQHADGPGRLVVELNAVESGADGCTFSFLLMNGLPGPIESMILEAVLFDAGGQVERLTLFDFGRLPAGRPRVRQFAVPGPACDGFGSVLINGAETCETEVGAAAVCEESLDLRSRVGIELLG